MPFVLHLNVVFPIFKIEDKFMINTQNNFNRDAGAIGSMVPNILILNTEADLSPDVYNPVAHIAEHLDRLNLGYTAASVKEDLSDQFLAEKTHLIVTGSSSSVAKSKSLPPWHCSAERFVRLAIDQGIPVLGLCYGFQFLARIFGDENTVDFAARPEVGWKEIFITEDDKILGSKGQKFFAYNLHFDEVVELPEDLNLLARTNDCAIHAFKHKEKPVWGLQSHPEIKPEVALDVMTKCLDEFSVEKKPFIEIALDQVPQDSDLIVKLLFRFLNMGGA